MKISRPLTACLDHSLQEGPLPTRQVRRRYFSRPFHGSRPPVSFLPTRFFVADFQLQAHLVDLFRRVTLNMKDRKSVLRNVFNDPQDPKSGVKEVVDLFFEIGNDDPEAERASAAFFLNCRPAPH